MRRSGPWRPLCCKKTIRPQRGLIVPVCAGCQQQLSSWPQPQLQLPPIPLPQQQSRRTSRMIHRQPQSLPLFHIFLSPRLPYSGVSYAGGRAVGTRNGNFAAKRRGRRCRGPKRPAFSRG